MQGLPVVRHLRRIPAGRALWPQVRLEAGATLGPPGTVQVPALRTAGVP